MPLLQGQPFKLITPPDLIPDESNIYTIQHTGEIFLNKSDYEDRLALYSQSIWTCQCTGRTGLTHKEAWMSEAKVRVAAKSAVPVALQKSLLSLVHHSLSPLEQLIDAASILCHSQYHVGEEVNLLYPKEVKVKIVNSKEIPKCHQSMTNGALCGKEKESLSNGEANGVTRDESPGTSPGKENQTKETQSSKDDGSFRKEMLPKLYDVVTFDDQKLIENVPAKDLVRTYKIPSKDQLRLFIRSCALRHRGTTCTPWVVADDLVKKFNLSNKLPSLILSSPKPNQASSKRKAQSPAVEVVKRPKSESSTSGKDKPQHVSKVPPLVLKSENASVPSRTENKNNLTNYSPQHSQPSPIKTNPKPSWSSMTKHPLSLGKPKIFPKPSSAVKPPKAPLPVSKTNAPRKRGRPPLTAEEKERNKRIREATLLDLSNKLASQDEKSLNIIKVKPHPDNYSSKTPGYPQPSNSIIGSPYKSPVKRANTPEAIMKLPFMKRFIHEHKTIKGVLGQFRRYAYTMDLVLSKLSQAQIEMIPDELLKQDLLTRQKKVQDKKFFEKLTPEEKKQFLKDKARTVALERWKERKLKNLKVEDQTLTGLVPLPKPALVKTPEPLPNIIFGDIVMITDFIMCFRELLLGEEKFQIMSTHLMDAIIAGAQGYKVIADIICCFLPTIIHDDISKNCKEIGVPISGIPITYQTAHELARLCLRKVEEEEVLCPTEDYYQLGKEKSELSDELMNKLEVCELWQLSCHEIVSVLKALVHKTLSTAAISVYVEEVEEKVLQTLRERRKFLKAAQKEQKAVMEKRKEQRMQNRIAKDNIPKKQRGRPKGYSPKIAAARNLQEIMKSRENEEIKETHEQSLSLIVQKRRISSEISKKEKAEMVKMEKERQKQLEESQKRQAMDRKYEDIVFKRDNLLRRTPVGFDRDHNRYWIFHITTPGLYVEKGWVDHNTDYRYSMQYGSVAPKSPIKSVIKEEPMKIKTEDLDEEKKFMSLYIKDEPKKSFPLKSEGENKVFAALSQEFNDDDKGGKPLTLMKSKIKKEMEEDNKLSNVKSKLSISPMKMTFRGRPPKETYVLVDEDTQTFPVISENKWYCYRTMEEIKNLVSSLSDQGQRESQLIAAININKEKLQYHFNQKPEHLRFSIDAANRLKESVKEDIIQIARELIEGWLGGIPNFEEWEKKAKQVEGVSELGGLLIEVQKHMQIKNLKSIMAPVKKEILTSNSNEGPTEYEDVEGPDVERWRDAVRSCRTYSRLHVLVGLFDSCIKWEKSMATRKCKVCRNKAKDDPLVMCFKCENSYHCYCLRPPLKEDPGESWICPACVPKKTRREESQAVEQECVIEDQDEKDDPTFSITGKGKQKRGRKKKVSKVVEKECSVCQGRIGLIFCSKCSTPYHSECHDPPLLSRARKDWICGICLNPQKAKSLKRNQLEEDTPIVRRNYFGNIEEVSYTKRSGNKGPRDQLGRFLKGSKFGSSSENPDMEDAVEDFEEDQIIDKFGRSIRGAKAKALVNIAIDPKHKNKDSRRSSRNQDKIKNYKDESEDEETDGSGTENESDNDKSGDENEDEDDDDDDQEEEEERGEERESDDEESSSESGEERVEASDEENEEEEEKEDEVVVVEEKESEKGDESEESESGDDSDENSSSCESDSETVKDSGQRLSDDSPDESQDESSSDSSSDSDDSDEDD